MLVEAHLHYVKYGWLPEGKFELWPCKIEWDKEKMFIKTVEIEVEETAVPSKEEITEWLITGLRKEIKEILADSFVKVSKLEDQIQQLLYLPAPQSTSDLDIDSDIPC